MKKTVISAIAVVAVIVALGIYSPKTLFLINVVVQLVIAHAWIVALPLGSVFLLMFLFSLLRENR